MSVVIFAAVAALMGFFLRRTRFGRLVYATGDKPNAARTTGLPTRPIITARGYVHHSFSEQFMNLIRTNLRELAH
ncbi:hypothetical protein [Mesorhizobium sp. B1-1-9]|uniref:ABC transporter permease subunit n=1 Tax=Mesorhizobium sp. B1-1-9 TaxID=2589975 RepID=UPI0015E42A0F|nr:hypothetical protein [Mesorhizobium sp. B1-1-9]